MSRFDQGIPCCDVYFFFKNNTKTITNLKYMIRDQAYADRKKTSTKKGEKKRAYVIFFLQSVFFLCADGSIP